MKEIVDSLADFLSFEGKVSTCIHAPQKETSAIPFSQLSFESIDTTHYLSSSSSSFSSSSSVDLVAVDGGQIVPFLSSSQALCFLRAAAVGYTQQRRSYKFVCEYFLAVRRSIKDGIAGFDAKVFPYRQDASTFEFPSFFFADTDDIFSRQEAPNPSAVINFCRRYLELLVADHAIADLGKSCGVVVLDGSLETKNARETQLLHSLIERAKSFGVSLCGLCKTTSYVTDIGRPAGDDIAARAQGMSIAGAWTFGPVLQSRSAKHKSDVFFVKLHKHSEYVFRLDLLPDLASVGAGDMDASKLFLVLAANATDSSFLGYPYALVDVDTVARVSENEGRFLAALLEQKMRGEFSMTSTNTHSVLDTM